MTPKPQQRKGKNNTGKIGWRERRQAKQDSKNRSSGGKANPGGRKGRTGKT